MTDEDPTAAMPTTPQSGQGEVERSGRALLWFIGAGVVAVAALVAGFVIVGNDDEAGASEVFLEPATSIGEDPFTDSVAEGGGPIEPAGGDSIDEENPPPSAVTATPADSPGLYGGTRNNSSCDRAKLIQFLKANLDKSSAWAGVLGIQVSEIETYIRSLTPVTLIDDVRVTNHGYSAGRATAIQSVLQSGTAVLVDQYGVPRVRCSCGNPLAPPKAVSKPVYTGDRWQWWSPGRITVIQTTTVIIDPFVLTDIPTGTIFTRPAGTDGSADGDAPDGRTTPTQPPETTTAAPPPAATTPTSSVATVPPSEPPSVTEADIIDMYFDKRDGECAGVQYPDFEPHISETQSASPRGDGTWDLRVVGITESGQQVFTWIVDPVSGSFTPTSDFARQAASHCAAWG